METQVNTIVDEILEEQSNPRPFELHVDQELFTATELIKANIESIPHLIEGLIPQEGLGALVGGSDVGKSTLLRKLAIDIITGRDSFLEFKINAKHKRVLYVVTEDAVKAIAYLMRKHTINHVAEELNNLHFLFVSDAREIKKKITDFISINPIDLIIIDCYGDLYTKQMNDTQNIRQWFKPYQRISRANKCFILFLHHTGKGAQYNGADKKNILGGQGFEAKMRVVIELRSDPGGDITKRHLCIVKGNYVADNNKTESSVLHFDTEHFDFTDTGERVSFDELCKKTNDEGRGIFRQIMECINSGNNYAQIAIKLGMSKGNVSKKRTAGIAKGWGEEFSGTVSMQETMETKQETPF